MLGWLRDEAARASLSKRLSRSGSAAPSSRRTLSAPTRPGRVSRARYTSPMPPRPRGAMILYAPKLEPGVRITPAPTRVAGSTGGPSAHAVKLRTWTDYMQRGRVPLLRSCRLDPRARLPGIAAVLGALSGPAELLWCDRRSHRSGRQWAADHTGRSAARRLGSRNLQLDRRAGARDLHRSGLRNRRRQLYEVGRLSKRTRERSRNALPDRPSAAASQLLSRIGARSTTSQGKGSRARSASLSVGSTRNPLSCARRFVKLCERSGTIVQSFRE